MDSDSWARISSSSSFSRRSLFRSDVYREEEYEGGDEQRPEYICPFCAEDFDIVGLCCHVDEEHAIEAMNGYGLPFFYKDWAPVVVCPICTKKVGSELVRHLTVQHASLLKVQRRRRMHKGVSNFSSILRKELREGNLQSFLGGSSFVVPSSHSEPDPLVSSLIFNPPAVDEPPTVQPSSSIEAKSMTEISVEDLADRNIQHSKLSDEDFKEKAQKCEFVQGILLSTFLDDNI